MPTPQHCPTPRELADLELLTGGAFAPVTGFNQPGSPVTLDLPPELSGQEVELGPDPCFIPNRQTIQHASAGPIRLRTLARSLGKSLDNSGVAGQLLTTCPQPSQSS